MQEALQEAGVVPGTDIWPMITGNGCKEDAVKRIASGTQAFSVFMDSRELADQCEEMVNVYLHGEDDPEVNDYEQYDNGVKIIGTYLCESQVIDRDNYEILIDNGYYSEKEVEPDPTEAPKPVTPTEAAEPTVTPTETPEEVSRHQLRQKHQLQRKRRSRQRSRLLRRSQPLRRHQHRPKRQRNNK